MDAIVERTSDRIRSVLEQWDTVDTVTVLKFGSDRYDPSFFISYGRVLPWKRTRSRSPGGSVSFRVGHGADGGWAEGSVFDR